jgi:hypothetical protein
MIENDSQVVATYDTQERPSYGFSDGHGTAMLSKVCGFSLGVAKRTSATIVKCQAQIRPECLFDALTKVFDDVALQGYTNVVVSMSLFWYTYILESIMTPAGTTLWINRMREVMNDLANRGVILVTGSGNDMMVRISAHFFVISSSISKHPLPIPRLFYYGGTHTYELCFTIVLYSWRIDKWLSLCTMGTFRVLPLTAIIVDY